MSYLPTRPPPVHWFQLTIHIAFDKLWHNPIISNFVFWFFPKRKSRIGALKATDALKAAYVLKATGALKVTGICPAFPRFFPRKE